MLPKGQRNAAPKVKVVPKLSQTCLKIFPRVFSKLFQGVGGVGSGEGGSKLRECFDMLVARTSSIGTYIYMSFSVLLYPCMYVLIE